MQEKILRRQFMKNVGRGVLAGASLSAIEPLIAKSAALNSPQGSMPRLFTGCCALSYSKELSSGQMTLQDLIEKAVQFRFDAIDVTTYYLKSVDPTYLAGLRHLAYQNAVAFSGVACGVSMAEPDPIKRAGNANDIKKWVDVAEHLGASHLRVFAGKLPPGATLQESVDWVVETMKIGCDYSARKGIMLGLEDHPGVAQTANVCLEVMQRVNSPYAGINLDITHFVPAPAQDHYAQIAACIPFATNVHIRDQFDDHTPIDMDRVWQLFAQAGFKGYMSAEYVSELSKDGAVAEIGVPKLIAQIQALCKRYSTV
jgi:sugar phosphate isomerase/epimerase